MRDTPEHVRMAEKLVASLDVPEPEVIMEVEVLEITHSLLEQLGINYPSNVSFSLTKPPNSEGAGTTGLVLGDIAKQNKNTISVSSLGVSVDLLKQVGVTSQQEVERIVREQNLHGKLKLKMVLTAKGTDLKHVIESEIEVD